MSQPNRITAGGHHFNGRLIDRNHPLRFRLDSRWIEGFAGDTVLSAALASGITGAGMRSDEPLALDERFAPPVIAKASAGDPPKALPMARMPAIDGAELITLGTRKTSLIARTGLVSPVRHGRLPQIYDQLRENAEPWTSQSAGDPQAVDLVVIGGGVAGLSAAFTAAKTGASVVLIERRQSFGGNARLFGALEGEEAPDAMIERLTTALAEFANVSLLPRTEALSVVGAQVRAHQVFVDGDTAGGKMLAFTARHIVLAAGSNERLPVFAGNRLPGIVGLAAAFDRADRFGIAIGANFAVSTAVNQGYRFAMLASDAGLTLRRMSDTRPGPSSRFIEFSKAYGMPLLSAQVPVSATMDARGGGLAIRFASTMPAVEASAEAVIADLLVVAGGWQPDLSLWLSVGGDARWSPEYNGIVAEGAVPNLTLAGSAAGYRSLSGCAQSGVAAAAGVFKRRVPVIRDIEIEALYETPDGPTPMAPADAAFSYLDNGWSLATRSQSLAGESRALGLGDVGAAVQLGTIPAVAAGIVARERCLPAIALVAAETAESRRPENPSPYPAYLAGRFGPKARLWRIGSESGRHIEAGALLYASSDKLPPSAAFGAVIRSAGEPLALIGDGVVKDGILVLRDGAQHINVRLIEPV